MYPQLLVLALLGALAPFSMGATCVLESRDFSAMKEYDSADNVINLIDQMPVAFAVRSSLTGEVLNDPAMVDWQVSLEQADDSGISRIRSEYGVHPCTAEDYERFYPVVREHRRTFQDLKQNYGLLCINKTDTKGRQVDLLERNRTTHINYVPCRPQVGTAEERFDRSKCQISNLTRRDLYERLEATKNYLGLPELVLFYSRVWVNPGFSTKVEETAMVRRQFSASLPAYANVEVLANKHIKDWSQGSAIRMTQGADFELSENRVSAWTDYPRKYKFFGLSFDLAKARKVTLDTGAADDTQFRQCLKQNSKPRYEARCAELYAKEAASCAGGFLSWFGN